MAVGLLFLYGLFYSVPAAIAHSSLHEIVTMFLVQCLSGTLFFLDPSSMLGS